MSAAVDGDAVALHPYLLIFPPVADVLPGGVVVAAVYLSYPRSIEVHRTLALRLLRRILRGLVLGQVLVDYRRYSCWVIQLTKSIIWVLQIPEIVPLVHPVRRPRY